MFLEEDSNLQLTVPHCLACSLSNVNPFLPFMYFYKVYDVLNCFDSSFHIMFQKINHLQARYYSNSQKKVNISLIIKIDYRKDLSFPILMNYTGLLSVRLKVWLCGSVCLSISQSRNEIWFE